MVKLRVIEGGRKDVARTASEQSERFLDTQGDIDTVTYSNRKGRKYYLFRVETKTGKARYVFRRNIEGQGETVLEVPDGFEIAESVNGIVSLRKVVESPIRADELETVRAFLKKHDHLARYRAEVVKGDIVVFEPIGGTSPELIEFVREFTWPFATPNLEKLDRNAQYSPVLRFRLVDEKKRRFHTERMTYRGEGGMMLLMNGNGSIREVTARFCKTLGRDSFFELY